MKTKFPLLWIFWTLVSAALVYGVLSQTADPGPADYLAYGLSFAPLLGTVMTLGSPGAAEQLRIWLITRSHGVWIASIALLFAFAIPGVVTAQFDPYNTVIFGVAVLVVFNVLKGLAEESFRLGWADMALWLILWIPFDLRWIMDFNEALADTSYAWWSVVVTLVGVLGWFAYRRADIGFRLVPNLRDLWVTAVALVGITLVVVPPGLLTGFLSFSVPENFDIPVRTLHFIGLFITVALPEELFFRGILLRGLDGVFSAKWIPMAISSVAFGLMHWNNAGTMSEQIIYASLAAIAGAGYGWAYRKSGNNLLAAVLTHTLVDWVWKLLFAG